MHRQIVEILERRAGAETARERGLGRRTERQSRGKEREEKRSLGCHKMHGLP